MPEVQPYDAPYPNAVVGWTGAIWHCLSVDVAGQLQIDVVDAAGLQDALQSINTDALQVRGEDQLFSFCQRLASTRTAIISGAGGYCDSFAVTAGRVWKVTNVLALDLASPTTRHTFRIQRGAAFYYFGQNIAAIAANESTYYHGEVWLEPTDVVRVAFQGALAGDNCMVGLTGYEMTKEV